MNKKHLLTAAAVAALVLLVLVLFRLGSPEGAGQPPASQRGAAAVPVAVAPITRGDITEKAVFTGSLVAAHRVEVATRIAGRLEHLHVDIGDAVAPGTLMAVLDDDEVAQNLEQARAELAVARASLEESQAALAAARRALTRTQELRTQRIASQSELEAAQTELEAQQARVALARSQIDQRQAAVRNAEIRLSHTRIHADAKTQDTPWRVAERFVDQGSLLQANTPILALVDLAPLRARVFVTERDYARLAPGQPVTLTTMAYPGETFTGRVERLSPEFRQASRQTQVEIHVPNEDQRLRPGMFVEARITTRALSDVTLVPVDALVERQGQSGLFLVEDTHEAGPTARFIPVDTGIETRDRVQIISPALEGRVVTLGHHLISDGTRLRPVARDEPDQVRAGSDAP
ncbi:RND family efflux transporter, MFP subunit [Ectothiorhodospira magna]|uniref:RND family efflux transporter, MFP subunit n=1 Tax=Ectothiorhodospira magna TaxID=867345 RepID=A0A1H9CTA3_9GAMM|nr:efflux RND transporter periplasmic adaptor subunit [Ectothiorhodospira magna]SEQ04452.1 RND family efflux transporter, MFP subunit [Ectothiorhodospira magna]